MHKYTFQIANALTIFKIKQHYCQNWKKTYQHPWIPIPAMVLRHALSHLLNQYFQPIYAKKLTYIEVMHEFNLCKTTKRRMVMRNKAY